MTDTTFANLGLAEPLCRALGAAGYVQPTAIQAEAIPALIAGKDLLGIAETGTGKTAAFALPILQKLAAAGGRSLPKSPRALILAPTRELAIQILENFREYGRNLRLSYATVLGGIGQRQQVDALRRGVDVVVATPGRLLDLFSQGHVSFAQVGILALDEADRMLDMGFVHDVRRIVAETPKDRQTILFSATMPSAINRLAAEILRSPVRVEVARAGKTVERVDQRVHFLEGAAKRDFLANLLADPALARVIVFTRTKRGADRVTAHLDGLGVTAQAIHGNKAQNARQRALEGFRTGRTRVLVATDIAARGIDVDDVTHVINYELPNEPESYVHRIGRTARAGAHGIAIAFCSREERGYLTAIERLTGQKLAVHGTPPVETSFAPDLGEEKRSAPQGRSGRPQSRKPASRDSAPRPERAAAPSREGRGSRPAQQEANRSHKNPGKRGGTSQQSAPRREGNTASAPWSGWTSRNKNQTAAPRTR